MTTTVFPSSSPSVVKAWSQRTLYDFNTGTEFLPEMTRVGIIRRQDELYKMAGDRVTVSWSQKLNDVGLIGNQSSVGLETSMNYYTDNLFIDQLRNVVGLPNSFTIDAQRVLYDLPEDTYRQLSEWMQVHAVLGIFNQLAGNTATSIVWDGQTYSGNNRLSVTGLNAATAPSTGSASRIFRQNGLTTDQAVAADTTATSKLSDVLTCEYIAENMQPYIRPISNSSQIKYHYYVDGQSYNNLIQDASSSMQYRDIYNSLITSGRGQGEIQRSFVFSQTRIFNAADKIPKGVDSGTSAAVDNTRRNVFVGKDAAGMALGKGYTANGNVNTGDDMGYGFHLNTQIVDVGQQLNVAMSGIFGIKKLTFNNNDNGVIVVTNYVANA